MWNVSLSKTASPLKQPINNVNVSEKYHIQYISWNSDWYDMMCMNNSEFCSIKLLYWIKYGFFIQYSTPLCIKRQMQYLKKCLKNSVNELENFEFSFRLTVECAGNRFAVQIYCIPVVYNLRRRGWRKKTGGMGAVWRIFCFFADEYDSHYLQVHEKNI